MNCLSLQAASTRDWFAKKLGGGYREKILIDPEKFTCLKDASSLRA
jgi:hypothetical protein